MKKLLLLLTILIAAIPTWANYSIYSISGKVTVVRSGNSVEAEKGMKVNASDQIEIAQGAKVEIYNSATKEIFTSSQPGKNSVMGIMLDARKQASKTAGAINDRMRFSAGSGSPDTRLYTEGLVKRSMLTYDPGAESLVVEPRALALHIAGAMRNPASLGDSGSKEAPIPVANLHNDNNGLQFKVKNTHDFPVYINVVKINETALGSIEISELGQPTGCYVLLPGQSIVRTHPAGLNPAESHILVLTHCSFDIDELIEHVNMIFADSITDSPDGNLPVFLKRL